MSIPAEGFWAGGAGGAPSQKLIPRVLLQPCLEALHTLVGTSRGLGGIKDLAWPDAQHSWSPLFSGIFPTPNLISI